MRLGKKQKRILQWMKEHKLVIRSVFDERDLSTEIHLEDEESNNTYEKLSPKFLQSLCDKKLFTHEQSRPCIQIHIDTFRLKPDSS